MNTPGRPANFRTQRSWRNALLYTAIAIYGPLLAMCLYTQGWIACSHCKAAVWTLAPTAPGLFTYELSRKAVDLPHFSSAPGVAASIVFTLLSLGLITTGMHYAGRWRIPVAVVILLASSWLAMALLSVIRM